MWKIAIGCALMLLAVSEAFGGQADPLERKWDSSICDARGECVPADCASIDELIAALKPEPGESADSVVQVPGRSATFKRDTALRLFHAAYRVIKKAHTGTRDGERVDACSNDLAKLADLVHQRMEDAGLRTFGSARIVSGMTMGSVNDGSGGVGSDDGTPKPGAAIEFETRHFNSDTGGIDIDVSFVGRVGYRPALTLVEVVPTAATPAEAGGASAAASAVKGKLQSAFGWSVGTQVQAHFAALHGEAGLVGRVGQTWISNSTVFEDHGRLSSLSAPFGAGDARWFFELGAQLRVYDRRLDDAHEENGLQSPLLALAAGVRRDNRYRVESDLVKFESPTGRLFVRAEVNGFKLTKELLTTPAPGSTGNAEPRNLSFVVEHEEGLKKDSGVPSATRFMVLGDASILGLLTGKK